MELEIARETDQNHVEVMGRMSGRVNDEAMMSKLPLLVVVVVVHQDLSPGEQRLGRIDKDATEVAGQGLDDLKPQVGHSIGSQVGPQSASDDRGHRAEHITRRAQVVTSW